MEKYVSSKSGFTLKEILAVILIIFLFMLLIAEKVYSKISLKEGIVAGNSIAIPTVGQAYVVTQTDPTAKVVIAIPFDENYVTNTLHRVLLKVNNDGIKVGSKFIRQKDNSDVLIDGLLYTKMMPKTEK